MIFSHKIILKWITKAIELIPNIKYIFNNLHNITLKHFNDTPKHTLKVSLKDKR